MEKKVGHELYIKYELSMPLLLRTLWSKKDMIVLTLCTVFSAFPPDCSVHHSPLERLAIIPYEVLFPRKSKGTQTID